MPDFLVKHREEKEINFAKYAWYIYAGWLLVGLIHTVLIDTNNLRLKILTPAMLLLANLFIVLTSKRSVKKYYIRIDEKGVAWRLPMFTRVEDIKWQECKWVKIEQFEMIFFRENSFSKRLAKNLFYQKDYDLFAQELYTQCMNKNIEYVDANAQTAFAKQ